MVLADTKLGQVLTSSYESTKVEVVHHSCKHLAVHISRFLPKKALIHSVGEPMTIFKDNYPMEFDLFKIHFNCLD